MEDSFARGDWSPDSPPRLYPARSPSLAITLFALATIVVVVGAPLLEHFGGRLQPIAYLFAFLGLLGLILVSVRRAMTARTKFGYLLGCSLEQWTALAVLSFFLSFYLVTRAGPTPFYEPSLQAVAFVHGRAWVNAPSYMEQVNLARCNRLLPQLASQPECAAGRFGGHTFLVHPPLAAILLMPIVALHGGVIDGADQYQPTVSAIVGAVEVALAWRLLLLLGLSVSARVWLTAFFGLGTTLWYEATLGSSWDFVLVVSVLPTLLALNEVFGKARPWLVGLLAGAAALGRNELVLVWPIYGALLLLRGRR
ncbi:MAG TPA: hypothetical protein VKV05_14470, partial [Terriglobales bacterium]|nr:hypothetical protein [Terriglobales bacterium]